MKRLKLSRFLAIALLMAAVGCASSGGTAGSDQDRSTVDVDNSSTSLADYLRRVPGVYVRGTGANISVHIQGIPSTAHSNEPLFVIDGVRIGRDYNRVSSLISMSNIDRIKVVKGTEAAIYGMEGGSGVIEITTKDSN